MFRAVISRDLKLYLRNKGEWAASVIFYVVVVSLFPLAVGTDKQNLMWLGPGAIWVAVLLAILLSQENLFRSELNSGVFEQMLICSHPLPFLVSGKMLAHWLVCGLPIVIISPFLGLAFSLDSYTTIILILTVLLGTPSLCALSAIGVSLTISLPRGGILLAMLVLPLYIPVLILGTMACSYAAQQLPVIGHLSLLLAIAIASTVLSPLAVASALRISLT